MSDDFRNQIFLGDCQEVLKGLPSDSIDLVFVDPPYGLGDKFPDMQRILSAWLAGDDTKVNNLDFMGRQWQLPGPKVWEQAFRVLKSDGFLCSFGGTRTQDLLMVAMSLAAEKQQGKYLTTVCWAYASGFPKSLSVEKVLEKDIIEAIQKSGIEFTGWEEDEQPVREKDQ